MNPNHNSNQHPAAIQQVNPVTNQQMFNGALFPNNMPVAAAAAAPCFMNAPFPLQNTSGHFPNGIVGGQQNFNPFSVNHSQQQQQGQLFPMVPYHQNVGEQVLVHNTIQNICQLLQLQNPSYNTTMFHNQFMNQQQFGMNGNPFLPGSVQIQQQPHATLTNFQNQTPQGVGPQNHSFFTNQMFGMANFSDNMQNVNQGQPGFVSSKTDVNALRQIGETHNLSPTVTNFEGNHKNAPTNVNGGWIESQHKNFTGHKTYDASHKGSKSHKHVKEKFGIYKGNTRKEGGNKLAADSASRGSTNFGKKVPSLNYSEQEIKEWREARKKHYPTNGKKHRKEQTSSNVEAMQRRQQLKEILAKQAELGCEVADISEAYLSFPPLREKKRQQYKKGKFHNKRDQKPNHQNQTKREPSLLQKLLTQDIKKDKNHLLQVLRFITANSFLTNGESFTFPCVIVRETNVAQETTCSVFKAEEEEEEGEIID